MTGPRARINSASSQLLEYISNVLNSKYFRNRNRYSSKHFNRATKFSFPRLVTYFSRLVFGTVGREASAFLAELGGDGALVKVGGGTINQGTQETQTGRVP